jgi:hypothetical protein
MKLFEVPADNRCPILVEIVYKQYVKPGRSAGLCCGGCEIVLDYDIMHVFERWPLFLAALLRQRWCSSQLVEQ